MKKFWKKGGFLLAVLVLFLALDLGLRASGWVQKSGYFALDDFEITRRDHPEPVWNGVIFGSSELISAYREDLSETGYVNLGMDYGTAEDLYRLLDGGFIRALGSDIHGTDLGYAEYLRALRTLGPRAETLEHRMRVLLEDEPE